MNRTLLTSLLAIILMGSIQAQNAYHFDNFEIIENEIYESKSRFISLSKSKYEIILIDYYQQADTNCYRITSSINALEILTRKSCAYIFENELMTFIYCTDSLSISDTLILDKAFSLSLKALELPQREINWKENAYYNCFLLYEWTSIFDPFIIEYRYFEGKLLDENFHYKRYYKRIRPKCILTVENYGNCECR